MSVLTFRKNVAGVALIGFPLAGFVSCFTDSDEGIGESGRDLYATISAHSGGIWLTGLIFMVSAILAAPVAFGLTHVLSHRGAVLGHLGAACLLIGSFGHFGYAIWQLMATRTAGGPADAMAAYLDRANDLQVVLIPMLILIDVGALLLALALLRARVVAGWAPWLAIAAMVADFGIQFGGVSATWPVTAVWGASTIAFGYVGVRLLAMPTQQWASYNLSAPGHIATGSPLPVPVA